MKRIFITRIIPLVFALAVALVIQQWLTIDAAEDMVLRLLGNDNTPPPEARTDGDV